MTRGDDWLDELNRNGASPEVLARLHIDKDDEKEFKDRVNNGRTFSRYLSITSLEDARAYERELQRLRNENVLLIRIPFFGITFDINDAQLLTGSSFVVLLIVLRLMLHRELLNLKKVFERITIPDKNDHWGWYDALSTAQVLTSPPIRGEKNDDLFWKHVAKILVVLPVLVHATIVIHDAQTIGKGIAYAPILTVFCVSSGFAALFLIAVLSWSCFWLMISIDNEWSCAFKEIKSLESKDAKCH